MKRNAVRKARFRSGMTLIELLVVVAILGLLGVAVLPALNGNRENQSNRSAAQQVSSLLNQSRNDAIAVGRPGGMTISSNELDVARCRVPPPYRGETPNAMMRFSPSAHPAINVIPSATAVISGLQPFDPSDEYSPNRVGVAVGDRIRFAGIATEYQIADRSPLSGVAYVSDSGFRISPVGSTVTTALPPAGSVPLEWVWMAFAIERQPRVVGTVISLANEACVDLTWSGFGSENDYATFASAIGSLSPVVPVSIVFGEAGAIDVLIIDGERVVPTGPICLLVGRTDRRSNSYAPTAGPSAADDSIGLNWQYPTSYWVVINNSDGQVRLAEAAPIEVPGDGFDNDSDGLVDELIEIPGNGIDDDGDTVVDELQEVVSSQRWAREVMTAGGL